MLPIPIELKITIDDYQCTVYEWEGTEPTVFFCHATGFHARVWDKIVSKLNGMHCISADLRGHGKSTKTPPPYPWDSFVPDMEKIAATLELKKMIGVGHSMGGHVISKMAVRNPALVTGLVLCDPSLFPSNRYRTKSNSKQSGGNHPVAKRRNEWDSPQQMYDRLITHPNFGRWETQVLQDYCNHGLHPTRNGDFVLSCPPEVEASMYGAYIDPIIIDEITKYSNPVRILYARSRSKDHSFSDFGPSVSREDLDQIFPNATSIRYDNLSHFLPMENTQLVADAIKTLIKSGRDPTG
jgi:pimeloyl-ACP methyl ester carboxylesterase